MILDQRHLTGPVPLNTVEQLRATWQEIAARMNPPQRLVETDAEVEAYVSDSRWVADCPFCPSGVACWPEHALACCFACYRIVRVKFPPKRDLDRALALLLERPPPARHWWPHRGETVATLAAENEEHKPTIDAFQGRS